MASRLLISLEGRIARARDAQEQACLKAERAALLARQGSLNEARAELATIHARYDSRPNGLVSAWVSFAEGLVAFHASSNLAARDKLRRAFALSSAFSDMVGRSFSAAWLAHLEYLEQDFEPMARHLDIALTAPPTDGDSALARACLVAAQAYHWADRFDLAQPWYRKARRLAAQVGDETVVSALMHNMAWLRVAEARRMAVSGVGDQVALRQVLLGADSTRSFDLHIGTASLQSLVPILRAHILALLDRYTDALELFEVHLTPALSEGLARMQCGALAEIGWCRANSGDCSGALREALQAQARILDCRQPDERAAAHGRLAQVFEMLGDPTNASWHRFEAELDWQLHQRRQGCLLELLRTTTDSLAH